MRKRNIDLEDELASPQSADNTYDASGLWPVTEDGWQVICLTRSLYPGGPNACKVVSPIGAFFFGLEFEPMAATVKTAVVTNFGRSSLRLPAHQVLVSPGSLELAQGKVRAYIMANADRFHTCPVQALEFSAGDGEQVGVF